MNSIRFSIIIPVYNSREYLDECIQSVINQTYLNWELILIDDGSSDGSGFICNKYATTEKRIIVVHQSNKGQFASRLVGIERASGDYILFSDSDDYLFKNAFEIILPYCNDKYDAVFFSYTKSEKQIIPLEQNAKLYDINNLSELRMRVLLNKHSSMSAKCVKSSILKSVSIDNKYLNKNYGEDFIHTMILMDTINSVAVLNNQLFYYRQHALSTSHSGINFFSFSSLFNFNVFDLQKSFLIKWGLNSEDNQLSIYSYWLNHCCLYLIDAINDPRFKNKAPSNYFECKFFGDKQDEFLSKVESSNLSKKKKRLLLAYYNKKQVLFNYIKMRIRLHKVLRK